MRQLLLRVAFHIALVVGWWQMAAAQETCALDTLFAGDGANRPVAVAPTRAGTLFILDRSEETVRLLDAGGRARIFLQQRDPVRNQERFSALSLHPQYPDSPFVYLLVTHPLRPAAFVRYRDSASVAISPDTLWSAAEPGTAAGTIRTGPANTFMLILRGSGEEGTSMRGKSTHVVYFPIAPEESDGLKVVETDDRDIVDAVYDPSTRLFYCVVRPDADPRAERSLAVYDDPDLDTPVREIVLRSQAGRSLPMGALALYKGGAFPRLAGCLITTARGTTALWNYRPTEVFDTDTAFTFLSHGFGFSDVTVGPDGNLYAISGPYDNAMVLRIRPTMPRFLSVPPDTAWENREYRYTPVCDGTSAALALESAPSGMVLDTASWTIRWTPGQEHVREGNFTALLLARNGAGTAKQEIVLHVMNVNDPPTPPELLSPDNEAVLQFVDVDPALLFSWKRSTDPDGDTVHYSMQIDTLMEFTSDPPMRSVVGTGDSVRITLPPRDGTYYWRVIASDGTVAVASQPLSRTLRITFVRTEKVKQERRVEEPSAGPVLEQNFPNPFNPTTSIKYTIPQAGHVRLSVYNLLGQELAVIFEGNQSEGTHEVEFNVESLPSGIYFYRIQAPGLVETKKMVVTR